MGKEYGHEARQEQTTKRQARTVKNHKMIPCSCLLGDSSLVLLSSQGKYGGVSG